MKLFISSDKNETMLSVILQSWVATISWGQGVLYYIALKQLINSPQPSLRPAEWELEIRQNGQQSGLIQVILHTHRGRVMHIYVSKLTIIGSDNGLSPGRRQAIIWANSGILLIGPFGTNFSEILIEIHAFSFRKMHLKMSSGKWWPFCLGLNVNSLATGRSRCNFRNAIVTLILLIGIFRFYE